MTTLTIDGAEITVEPGSTVMQACVQAGKEIPHFCFHDRLSIAGNCRMCLVEMERSPKPIASCAMPAADGMVIRTDTPSVKKAREGVMEFLLINHPLDCPICDQGGECDLQDQALFYGADTSRFEENKRAVPDKDMGPLIKTTMTRCIHCTRCIRFAEEVAGVPSIGAVGRSEHMEITTLERAVESELSGNVIDLCPVGALTSKPYAFNARPWELRKTEGIDVFDALGANIRIDSRGSEVLRILPRLNEEVNEEWLGDKSRFAHDGLRRQRLDRPYVRRNGRLHPANWGEAFEAIRKRMEDRAGTDIGAIAGDQADAESMQALKDLMQALGSPHLDCRQDGAAVIPGQRSSYLFNSTVQGIEEADALLLIGCNPRWESPVLNSRIRKRWLAGGLQVGVIGEAHELGYRYDHLGTGGQTLRGAAAGRNRFCAVLKDASRPMLIVGAGALARPDGAAVLAATQRMAELNGLISKDWNGFNVLNRAASRVGGLDLGFMPGEGGADTGGMLSGAVDTLFLLGADEIDLDGLGDAFVIYQGHHGDAGAARADVILPGAAYTEKSGTWVNLEGRVQRSERATFPPGEAREDWRILRALSEALGKPLPCDTVEQVRARMAEIAPVFAGIGSVEAAAWEAFGEDGGPDAGPFGTVVDNYYMTDPISRSSETMAACTRAFLSPAEAKTGTDG
jgi:NADH-quinone oxidoreductase subunit G